MASAWGSDFIDCGAAGHLNADSGLGNWPQGQALLNELLKD
jgi:predicted alpha/beta hydrolase family esterase